MNKHVENEDGARISRSTQLKAGVIAGAEVVNPQATANPVEAAAMKGHSTRSTTMSIGTGPVDAVATATQAETGTWATFADTSDSIFDTESQTPLPIQS